MSTSEGTNATTGTVELTARQRKALVSKLVKFCSKADKITGDLVVEALVLIDECIDGKVWTVAVNADGKPFENGYDFILETISAAPNFHKAIAQPIAERLLSVTDDKGKKAFTVRKIEAATGVSRGVLDRMNKAAKESRSPRPNDGTASTDSTGKQESEERIAAKRAIKRADGAVQAILDTVADMTVDERTAMVDLLSSTIDKIDAMVVIDPNAATATADEADTTAADEAARKSA